MNHIIEGPKQFDSLATKTMAGMQGVCEVASGPFIITDHLWNASQWMQGVYLG
jgi:hypothetical protein